jgi:hypothetical protein
MYKIIGYSGGVYRFDEVVECVEDAGGIVINRDEFNVSRGSYFIAQEVHVIIITPEEGLNDIKTISSELKGDIEELNIDDEIKLATISIIPVYNLLSREGSWVDIDTIESMIDCPCINGICQEFDSISCIKNLEKTLTDMCRMEIAEKRTGTNQYRLKKD